MTLPVREAYAQWAPHYDSETAVTRLEDLMIRGLPRPAAGARVLDAGCGTGRRLRQLGHARPVGIDLTFEMLAHARARWPLAAADVRALPFPGPTFDAVFCRLVLGHVAQLSQAYGELARVSRQGATIVVTDFHAAAVQAGHRRTFTGADGRTHEVEHYVHTPDDHWRAARAAGLRLERSDNGVVGPDIRDVYAAAGKTAQYHAQGGLPLVLLFVCRAHSS